MKKVLVTGATGFLGAYILEELKEKFDLIAVGRNGKRLEELREKHINLECIKQDLTNLNSTLELPIADIVVHSAALSTVWGTWEEFYENNVTATKNIIEYCKKNKVKKIIFISTPSIYTEKRDRFNIKENEFDENNELNYYIKSKIICEKLILDSESKDLEVVIIRPKGLIGIGDTSILPRILYTNKKIGIPVFKENKEVLIDLTSVENVAYSVLLSVEKNGISGEIFNITNGNPTVQKEILEILEKNIGIKLKYKTLSFKKVYIIASILEKIYKIFRVKKEPIVTKYTVCTLAFSQTLNIEKAREILGYEPRITLEDEIKRFADHYKNNQKEYE